VDASNAKLEVQFFWPFKGNYWIVDLGPDYEYAVVGHPARKYLWILSRTPRMDEATYQAILGRLREQGYDLSRLERTLQPPAAG
jgi:apolipoprotein D and lipocalin family protein